MASGEGIEEGGGHTKPLSCGGDIRLCACWKKSNEYDKGGLEKS